MSFLPHSRSSRPSTPQTNLQAEILKVWPGAVDVVGIHGNIQSGKRFFLPSAVLPWSRSQGCSPKPTPFPKHPPHMSPGGMHKLVDLRKDKVEEQQHPDALKAVAPYVLLAARFVSTYSLSPPLLQPNTPQSSLCAHTAAEQVQLPSMTPHTGDTA